ncbi:hypothetical protein ACQP3F_27015, partial [Escherichia coli]
CLEDQRCCRAVEKGQEVLEQLKEERSPKSEKESIDESSEGSSSDAEEELEMLAEKKWRGHLCGSV